MKAYMELVNNMLLTAEVQQTLGTPHTYRSDCRQESFRIFPCSGNSAVLRLGHQLWRWKETGINSALWIACMCDCPHLCQGCHNSCTSTWPENACGSWHPTAPAGWPGTLLSLSPCCVCWEPGILCAACLWAVQVTQTWRGRSVGSAGKMEVTEELRAGHLCLQLSVVWATGPGFWSQIGFGAGEVRTRNWAFAFQF